MGITKDYLLKQMKKLETNYGKDKFVMTQDIFDLWFDMFKDCAEEGLTEAVNRCIKENEFAPNVAGLMKYYRTIADAHNELIELVKRQYTTMRSIWCEPYFDTTFMELYEYVNRFPENTRKTELVEFTQRAVSFRHDCDECGRVDIPTISQYIKGER